MRCEIMSDLELSQKHPTFYEHLTFLVRAGWVNEYIPEKYPVNYGRYNERGQYETYEVWNYHLWVLAERCPVKDRKHIFTTLRRLGKKTNIAPHIFKRRGCCNGRFPLQHPFKMELPILDQAQMRVVRGRAKESKIPFITGIENDSIYAYADDENDLALLKLIL